MWPASRSRTGNFIDAASAPVLDVTFNGSGNLVVLENLFDHTLTTHGSGGNYLFYNASNTTLDAPVSGPSSVSNNDSITIAGSKNDNGQPAIWLMNGLNSKVETGVGDNPGPSW